MPPKSDPRREEALRLYLESDGKKSLQCIANELGLSKSTVASWKVRGDWESQLRPKGRKRRSQTSDANGERKKAGYFGNKNAAGTREDVSNFMGNKNALKHGRYEEIKYETLNDQERELMAQIPENPDPVQMQAILIRELEIREMRMLQRIERLRAQAAADPDGFVPDSASVEQKGNGKSNGKTSVKAKKTRASAMDKIQAIEAALSVIQRQKQSAILALHKLQQDELAYTLESERLELQKQRVELDRRRLALIDPSEESDSLAEAKRLLEGIPSAF